MGRSNALPLDRHHKHERGNIKPTTRRAPEISKHHCYIPHVRAPSRSCSNQPYKASHAAQRPGDGLNRQNSSQTHYVNMLLALDTIPRLHNILAAFFTWILLAGFVIFPGTFTSISKLEDAAEVADNEAASAILKTVKNTPLLVIAGACCGVGALGMAWLWYKWRANSVWLLNRIFLPGCLNSLAGLISSLVSVYTQQRGNLSLTARITTIVAGSSMVVTGLLFGLYNFWILESVKREHERETSAATGEEGIVERMRKKTHEPALQPGSVV
ncbi:hypothetical protein PZA11_003907 [Diplocarpon coronariae]|uniref:Uncharacterized protein n=1 Tax=Diplocarpon coronariae TaxID=2795749 RepID=A0A218ZFC0_9HELO|nr:hypothetical protein JHW43_007566 [Diplocarpon mali]OWP06769.1 hypothetical protein B2J93_8826 [Marssonina coronariae]